MFFVKKSGNWEFFCKKWTFPQRRVHYFLFHILLIWGVRTHPRFHTGLYLHDCLSQTHSRNFVETVPQYCKSTALVYSNADVVNLFTVNVGRKFCDCVYTPTFTFVFTARRHASAVYTTACFTRVQVLWKRMKI